MAHTLEPPPETDAETDADAGMPLAVSVTAEERVALLDLARAAVAVAARAAARSTIDDALARHPASDRTGAAFVTLTEDGELRGCVGHMDAGSLLAASVIEAATWATIGDPRFSSVRAAELPRLHLEVSVLGPLVPVGDPVRWRPGVDGMVVERGGRRGLLLPEVWAMLGNDGRAMFETTCRKAGLPGDAWRDAGTTLYAFRTARFGGPVLAEDRAS